MGGVKQARVFAGEVTVERKHRCLLLLFDYIQNIQILHDVVVGLRLNLSNTFELTEDEV